MSNINYGKPPRKKRGNRGGRRGHKTNHENKNNFTEEGEFEGGEDSWNKDTMEVDQAEEGLYPEQPNLERPRGYDSSQAFFGYLEPELQKYFKGVQEQLDDPMFQRNNDHQLFLEAVYGELEGKELILATDHTSSVVLEKLIKVSTDFQLRVFFDKMAGNAYKLITHRFASHVMQTLISLSADVVERSIKNGLRPELHEPEVAQQTEHDLGVLDSMEDLLLNFCKEIKPNLSSLISDPYASHVFRVLLFVLSGKPINEDLFHNNILRSKKSGKYKGENNNIETKAKTKNPRRIVPPSFPQMLHDLTTSLITSLSETVTRTLSVHRVANPVLQLLLEFQADTDEGISTRDLLINRILWGVLSENSDTTKASEDQMAWIETLLRDVAGAYLMEKIVKFASQTVFHKLFTRFFRGRLNKLAAHPNANHVVQQMFLSNRTQAQLELMIEELGDNFEQLIKHNRAGIIHAAIETSGKLNACEKETIKALCKALHMNSLVERKDFIQCCIRLITYEEWAAITDKAEMSRITMIGAQIIQSILKLPQEHHAIVVASFSAQPQELIYAWTYQKSASFVIEGLLKSSAVDLKVKKKIVKGWMGHYHEMAQDTVASRVVDLCWLAADLAAKEKIAAELVEHEALISTSFSGKFVLRNCRIEDFKRKKNEWIERERGAEKKREMFREIIDGSAGKSITGKINGVEVVLPPNPEIAKLGFADGIKENGERKKKKKGKKSTADYINKMLLDDETAVETENTKGMDEIDKLFKKKSKNSRSRQEESERDASSDESEHEEDINKKKKIKKAPKDLVSVLEAIDATKKKKRSDTGVKSKKRKFEG